MATHVRTFRIPDQVWSDTLELAERDEKTATAVVLEALAEYLKGAHDE